MTMKCPNCGAEFVDGREICTDCQAALVKKEESGKTGIGEFTREGVDVEKLTSVSDHLEAELLQGILENHGIPSYSLDQESGGYMKIYMGYSIFGEEIYVRSSDFAEAKECLEEWESLKKSEAAGEDGSFCENGESAGEDGSFCENGESAGEDGSFCENGEAAGEDGRFCEDGEAAGEDEEACEDGDMAGGNPLMIKDRRLAAVIMLIAAVILGIITVSPHIP